MTRKVLEVMGGSTGGIARHVAAIVEHLDGIDELCIDIAAPPDLQVPMPKPIYPIAIPDGPARGHGEAIRRLGSLVRAGSYDVVHAHGLRAGIDAGIAARGHAHRIATVHNLILDGASGKLKTVLYRRAEALVVALNERVLAPSKEIAAQLEARAPRLRQRIETLHLGAGTPSVPAVSAAAIRDELGVGPGRTLVVTVARLAPQKALHVLLDALALMDSDVRLAVVGDGPLAGELRERARKAGIDSRVRWVGYKDDSTSYIAAADVFVLSSVWEACSLAAQEAMSLGVPVVSTAVGGMPELIADRISGRLSPSGDARALAAAISDVLCSPSDARRYIEAASEHLAHEFSTERMLARLRSIYLEGAFGA